jgi:PBP1b-binding outer membrane lipoprotein LpoB
MVVMRSAYLDPLHLPGDSKIKIHFLWAIIVVVLVSCVQIPQAPTESAKSNVSETTTNETSTTSEPYDSQTMPTPQSAETPGIQPIQVPNQQEAILSQSAQPALVTETATIITTSSLDDVTITGQLFVFEPGGIRQINLPDKESTNLFETENDLSNWGARFAQNKKLGFGYYRNGYGLG